MVVKNCVTLNATSEVLRYGTVDFENDGQYNPSIETFHADVGNRPEGIPLFYLKVNGGVLVEMSSGEKAIVDAAHVIINQDLVVNLGINAAASITTGKRTIALGNDTLVFVTSGSDNCAVGNLAMQEADATATQLSAFGNQAMQHVTTATNCTAGGFRSLYLIGDSSNNTAWGYRTGENISASGSTGNVIFGSQSMGNSTDMQNCIAFGNSAMLNADSCSRSIAIGGSALLNHTASKTIAIGHAAGLNVTSSVNTILIGDNVANTLTTGNNNIIIGTSVDVASSNEGNKIRIGVPGTHQFFLAGPTLQGGTITGATVLTAANSGTVYAVTTGTYAITLPVASAGLFYRFFIQTDSGGTLTIVTNAGSNHMYGSIQRNSLIGNQFLSVDAADTLTFSSGAGVGDWVEIFGATSTSWFVRGCSNGASGSLTSSS